MIKWGKCDFPKTFLYFLVYSNIYPYLYRRGVRDTAGIFFYTCCRKPSTVGRNLVLGYYEVSTVGSGFLFYRLELSTIGRNLLPVCLKLSTGSSWFPANILEYLSFKFLKLCQKKLQGSD